MQVAGVSPSGGAPAFLSQVVRSWRERSARAVRECSFTCPGAGDTRAVNCPRGQLHARRRTNCDMFTCLGAGARRTMRGTKRSRTLRPDPEGGCDNTMAPSSRPAALLALALALLLAATTLGASLASGKAPPPPVPAKATARRP